MDKKLLAILKSNRKQQYENPDSIMRKYDAFLEKNKIYHSLNKDIFNKSISGRIDLCDGMLKLYDKAKLENERIMLLSDLLTAGYNTDELVELVLETFFSGEQPSNLWAYAELIYSIKNFNYMPQYMTIIRDKSYGDSRQMLIILVGKSKNAGVVPVLKELLNDSTVCGHALEALSNFSGKDIKMIMQRYLNHNIAWIRKIAENYLNTNNQGT